MKIREKCEFVTVNAGENLAKLRARNYVRPTKHSVLLPYFDELEEKADENLQQLLNGVYACYATDNVREGAEYTENLRDYLNTFGLRMPKETLFNLIRFFYEVLCREHQREEMLESTISCLRLIMSLAEPLSFGWRDLTLEWRPLFEIFSKSMDRKIYKYQWRDLGVVANKLARFYDPREQEAIWNECMKYYCYGSGQSSFHTHCWNFLSIQGLTGQEVKEYSVVWIKKLCDMFVEAEMTQYWTTVCIDFIADLVAKAPEAMDMSPLYDTLYTKLMRSFMLTVRDGKIAIGDDTECDGLPQLTTVCAFTIGGPNSSLSHFKRLIQYIHFTVYPTNSGDHDQMINKFFQTFIMIFHSRIQQERLDYVKRRVPKEYYLTDADIDAVTDTILDMVIMMMHSENFKSDFQIIYCLNSINRELVAPKLLDHFYSSISAVTEPQRLSNTIQCFSSTIFDIIRSPPSEFRAPRDIVYDSHWIKVMEEERKNWSTYEFGSEVPQVATHRFTSLRAHAFYIMEILVNEINVNDVDRTVHVLKTLDLLFASIPLMDFSSAVQFHGAEMSDDDKILCLLSKRLPRLLKFALEKVLVVISCFSFTPPKSSSAAAGASISTESQQVEGEEEAVLKKWIESNLSTMFDKVDDKFKGVLCSIIFDFVKTSEFTNYWATDLLSTVVYLAAYRSRSFCRKVAEHVLSRLKELLTEDVKKSKTAPSALLYNAILAQAIYLVPHDILLEHETIILEITDLLLSSECKSVNKTATKGISQMLFTMTQVYTEFSESPENLTFAKPLSEWNPIKEWARCNDYSQTVIKWYIPAKPELEFTQRIANRYFFPVIEQMQPGKLDRHHLRRAVRHVRTLVEGINVFRHPDNTTPVADVYADYCLPITQYSLGNTATLESELKSPNGENSRELLLSMVERMIPNTYDPKVFSDLARIAYYCFGRGLGVVANVESTLQVSNLLLRDSTTSSIRKASQYTMHELAHLKHRSIVSYHKNQMRQPDTFDQRILKCLTELAMNDYSDVRMEATALLMMDLKYLLRCRDMIIPQVCAVLTDQESKNTDRLCGAIAITLELDWLKTWNPKFRLVLWDAVIRVPVHDLLIVRLHFDEIVEYCQYMPSRRIELLGTPETHVQRNKKVVEAGSNLIKFTDSWAPYLSEESIQKQTYVFQEEEKCAKQLRAQLADMLIKHIHNPNLHHTRHKLARTLLYASQLEASDERTIRLMTAQMLSDDEELRVVARENLAFWLKKNKPKTVRVDINMPKKPVTMESGIREDNLWIVYDSENLPDTEQKWNETTFLEKENGACQWPSKISVVRKRKDGPPLESKAPTLADKVILEFFSSESSVESFMKLRVLDKELVPYWETSTSNIFKYVIRNYPDVSKPLELLIGHLKKLLNSKERHEQSTAVELFVGIAKGLKHHPFPVLDAFWKDITVRLDKFFNIMVDEAEFEWKTGLTAVLGSDNDYRRCWWLVESLMDGARRSSASSECQQAFRLYLLMNKNWRYAEITNRLSVIAWNKLPSTLTDSLRRLIADVLHIASRARERNRKATLKNIPKRLIPKSFDEILEMFIDEIPQLKTAGSLQLQTPARSSQSDSTMSTPSRKRPLSSPTSNGASSAKRRKRSLSLSSTSSSDCEERTIMTYFRTVLELIRQYCDGATQVFTPTLLQILPKLMEFANEESFDLDEEMYRDVDINRSAAKIIHDYMSGALLSEGFVEQIVKSWKTTFENSPGQHRVRLAVVKFMQACIYANIFTMNRENRPKHVEQLLFQAVVDPSIEVRREASKCLLLLMHCDYICPTDAEIDGFARDLDSHRNGGIDKKADALIEARMHGAALVLGAIALAFPFTLPVDKILKPLRILNAKSTKRPIVEKTVTEILREFRRQHRDDWQKTKTVLGAELVYDIENATAPAYYA